MTDSRNSVAGNVYSNNHLLIDHYRLSSTRTEAYRQTEAVLWPFHVQTVRPSFFFIFISVNVCNCSLGVTFVAFGYSVLCVVHTMKFQQSPNFGLNVMYTMEFN